jgi:hypothetical protein
MALIGSSPVSLLCVMVSVPLDLTVIDKLKLTLSLSSPRMAWQLKQ